MQSIRLLSLNKTDASDVRLVIHTVHLYVALHKTERYTAQKWFYQ